MKDGSGGRGKLPSSRERVVLHPFAQSELGDLARRRGRDVGSEDYVVGQPGFVNGLPGFITLEADGELQTIALEIDDGNVAAIYVVRNPTS